MARVNDEIYPNSPLVDVACEIRFPGEMQVECDRHIFWDRIRSDYPNILVPHAQPGQAPALQHYRFQSANAERTVMVALNSFSYSESHYSGHRKFTVEFVRLFKIFCECFPGIDQVKRIGWRYVNVIPFVREQQHIPINRALNFLFPLPTQLTDQVVAIQLRTELPVRDGIIIFQLSNVSKNDEQSFEGLLVDIDCVKHAQGLRARNVPTQVRHVHTQSREFFEHLITDEYREYLRGHTL